MAKQKEETIEDIPKLKECFIITPIGEKNTETYSKANGLIEAVISPVLTEFGYKSVASHNLPDAGSITTKILTYILECDIVIANLTGLNPNVLYELAVRHCVRRPVVILVEKAITSILPFDLKDQRVIFYEDSLAGAENLKKELNSFVKSALQDKNPDNPVYKAASQENIFKDLDDGSPLKIILDKIESLDNKISNLNKSNLQNINRFFSPGLLKPIKIEAEIVDDNGMPYNQIPQEIQNKINQLVQNSTMAYGVNILSLSYRISTLRISLFSDSETEFNLFSQFLFRIPGINEVKLIPQ